MDSSTRALGTGILLVIFSIIQLADRDRNFEIYAVDFWWLVLIIFSGTSALWATDASIAIHGMYTTALTYLSYKAFEKVDWEPQSVRNAFFWAVSFCLFVALSLQLYSIRDIILSGFSKSNVDNEIIASFFKSKELLASLITILIPFVIFNEKKISGYIAPVVLPLAFLAAKLSGLSEVAILLLLISVVYLLYRVSYKRNYKYFVLLGFIGLLASTLYLSTYHIAIDAANDKEYMMEEFPQQYQRVKVLKNNATLFKDAPLIGYGKNNWVLAYKQFGSYDNVISTKKNNNFVRPASPNCSIQNILIELGLVGLIIYAYIGIAPFLRLFNGRAILSKLEVAASVSLLLFAMLSLIYGSLYNGYNSFHGMPILAVLSLAIVSKKSNTSVFLMDTSNVFWKITFALIAIGSTIYFLIH